MVADDRPVHRALPARAVTDIRSGAVVGTRGGPVHDERPDVPLVLRRRLEVTEPEMTVLCATVFAADPPNNPSVKVERLSM